MLILQKQTGGQNTAKIFVENIYGNKSFFVKGHEECEEETKKNLFSD